MHFLKNKKITKIKGDASLRSFYRSKKSIIVYCKKDKYKNLLVYDSINKLFQKNKINAPKLINQKYKKNYIEIDDLGNNSVYHLIKKRKNKILIFKEVVKILLKLQNIRKFSITNFKKQSYKVPFYKKKLLLEESKLFIDWFLPYNFNKISFKEKKNFKKIIQDLINKLKLPNNTLVHRDFHISNMMFKKNKIYLIDSQDAVIGNITYDLASLIDDVRYKTSNKVKNKILKYYLKKKTNKINIQSFKNDFYILSVLRNLKILGIFTRLAIRDKKKYYLKMIPYCWKLIEDRINKNDILFNKLKAILNQKKFKKFIKVR